MNEGLAKRGRGALRDDWETPRGHFEALHRTFQFTVDAAASHANHLLPRYWTQEIDGLSKSWAGERVFCNPPYSEKERWAAKGANSGAAVVVMLLPVSTSPGWFHEYVIGQHAEVWFPTKRISFCIGGNSIGSPMFDSMIVIWWGGEQARQRRFSLIKTWRYRSEAAQAQIAERPRDPVTGRVGGEGE